MTFFRNITQITLANVAAQALQLAALPFISRYTPPSIFGIFTLFVGACVLLSICAGLRYEMAIVIARRNSQALLVARLVLILGFVTTFVTIGIGWPGLIFMGSYDVAQAGLLATLAATYVLGNTGVRIATNWLARHSRFGWVAVIQLTAVLISVSLQVGLLNMNVDPLLALVSGFAIGQAGTAALAFTCAAQGQLWIGRGRRLGLTSVAVRFINFPRYMILYSLNSSLRERFVHVLMGWGAGPAVLGQFAMGQRIFGAPHAFMHGGIGPVLLSRARIVSRAEVAKLVASLIELSSLVLTPLMLFLAFNADTFANLFGPEWSSMVNFLPWLVPAYLVLACTGFIDRLFELYGQQRVALKMDLGFSGLMLFGLLLASLSEYSLMMVVTFGVIYIFYEIYWTWCAHRANDLPLQALPRLAFVFSAQVTLWALVYSQLERIESLIVRVILACLVMLVVFIIHYRWLGGNQSVRFLFAKMKV